MSACCVSWMVIAVLFAGLFGWAYSTRSTDTSNRLFDNVAIVSHGRPDDVFWQRLNQGITDTAYLVNVNVDLLSFTSIDKFESILEQVCSTKPAIAVTVPFENASSYTRADSAINRCIDNGVHVHTFNTDTYQNERVQDYTGSNNYEMGYECGRLIAANLRNEALRDTISNSITNSSVKIYDKWDEDNDSLIRRRSGLLASLADHNIAVSNHARIVVFLTNKLADSAQEDPTYARKKLLCGDAFVEKRSYYQKGQNVWEQGSITLLRTSSPPNSLNIKGNEDNANDPHAWNTAAYDCLPHCSNSDPWCSTTGWAKCNSEDCYNCDECNPDTVACYKQNDAGNYDIVPCPDVYSCQYLNPPPPPSPPYFPGMCQPCLGYDTNNPKNCDQILETDSGTCQGEAGFHATYGCDCRGCHCASDRPYESRFCTGDGERTESEGHLGVGACDGLERDWALDRSYTIQIGTSLFCTRQHSWAAFSGENNIFYFYDKETVCAVDSLYHLCDTSESGWGQQFGTWSIKFKKSKSLTMRQKYIFAWYFVKVDYYPFWDPLVEHTGTGTGEIDLIEYQSVWTNTPNPKLFMNVFPTQGSKPAGWESGSLSYTPDIIQNLMDEWITIELECTNTTTTQKCTIHLMHPGIPFKSNAPEGVTQSEGKWSRVALETPIADAVEYSPVLSLWQDEGNAKPNFGDPANDCTYDIDGATKLEFKEYSFTPPSTQ